MLAPILLQYGLNDKNCKVLPHGSGLINRTWKVSCGQQSFILQRINHQVFKNPKDIADNLRLMAGHLRQHHPDYLFTAPVSTLSNEVLVHDRSLGFFRLFDFIPGSHTVDVVSTPEQAFEAARQFGKFTSLLSGLNLHQLHHTLPYFHHLTLRKEQFQQSLLHGNPDRIAAEAEAINFLQQQAVIADEYEAIQKNPAFRLRVTHHDTKISNVLFDGENKGLCVIDLDTVMPGYFISDVGDMMRTYLSPVSEEEKDFSLIQVRTEYFQAIVGGYLREMGHELSATEKNYFVYAGKFLIYMQALRFLTDYFNNDVYYGASYPAQNLTRAENQIVLLQRLLEKEEELKKLSATMAKHQ